MLTLPRMAVPDLENLEIGDGLNLAAQRCDLRYFRTYWEEEVKEDLSEVFKTSKYCNRFSKILQDTSHMYLSFCLGNLLAHCFRYNFYTTDQ